MSEATVRDIVNQLQHCCRRDCINDWLKEFGDAKKDAQKVILTERHVYAALGKGERQHNYTKRIEALVRTQYGSAVGVQASTVACR